MRTSRRASLSCFLFIFYEYHEETKYSCTMVLAIIKGYTDEVGWTRLVPRRSHFCAFVSKFFPLTDSRFTPFFLFVFRLLLFSRGLQLPLHPRIEPHFRPSRPPGPASCAPTPYFSHLCVYLDTRAI